MHTIVTHPGSAHKDDFLASCVLLAVLKDATVQRREPTAADMADPDTFVIDVGLEYAPDRHNFDHHHDPSLPCAFHLVMQHLGYHEMAMEAFIWYRHMSMMDVRGPYRTADHLGVDTSVLFASSSPIDGYIFSLFARAQELSRKDLLYRFMQNLGADMLDLIERKMQRLARLKAEARVVPVKHLRAVYSDIADEPKLAMDLYLRHLDDALIVLSITPSNRGDGWELLRLGDNTLVDFRALDGHPEVRFVHTGGFLAKTRTRLPMAEAVNLASLAIGGYPL